jgi:hypothetical protein
MTLDGSGPSRGWRPSQDQTFIVPARSALVSFDARTPASVVAEVGIGLEGLDPHPLYLDPFVLVDGRLAWTGLESVEAAL